MKKSFYKEFVDNNGIEPGDVLLVANLGAHLRSKYVPFLGWLDSGSPFFAVETNHGIRILSEVDLPILFNELRPSKVKRFKGNGQERRVIVDKARRNLNENTFNLVLNWCENANENSSPSNKKELATGAGIALAAIGIGLMIWGLTSSKDE